MSKIDNSQRKKGLARLIEIAGTKKWLLIGSMFLAVLATISQFIPVICINMIIAELSSNANNTSNIDQNYLYRLGFISLAAFGAFGILLYVSMMMSHIAAFNILYEIRIKIAEKLTRLSMGFFSKKSSGEIKKVMSEDVEKIELFVAHHIPDITCAAVFPVIIISYLFYLDWRLAIATVIPFPLIMVVMTGMLSNKEMYRRYHDSLEKMNASVVEYVRGMPVVKIFGSAAESFRTLKDSVLAHHAFNKNIAEDYSTVYPGFLTAASSSLLFIIPAALLIVSKTGINSEFISTFMVFLLLGGGLFFPVFKLIFMGSYFQQISVGVERIDAVMNKKEIEEIDNGKEPEDASVEFDNVSFAYNEKLVIKNVSFKARQGRVTAIVGPSGAGKTTVGLLAARFWETTSGSIRLGGVDIKEIKIQRLMEYISFVFQDNFLFFDTIEENIRIGNTKATREQVIESAKAANCHEFIEKLPKGYDTLVGEGGTYLSGGEQQRINLARTILKNTPVVILDEATAYADPENEGKILEGISKLIKNKTVIVIAHRLSTIINADNIIVIDEGKIIQQGTHDKLIACEGLYNTMWATYSRSREWIINKRES